MYDCTEGEGRRDGIKVDLVHPCGISRRCRLMAQSEMAWAFVSQVVVVEG